MKILWLSNIVFPEVCSKLGITPPVIGGWMQSGAKSLIKENSDIKLAVASLYQGNELLTIKDFSILYYLIPNKKGYQKYDSELEKYFSQIEKEFDPDIIHIHGSEYPHSLACAKACSTKRIVVSIQGLVSSYSRYYLGGIPISEVKKFRTLRDLIRHDDLITQQKKMQQRGIYEKELLQIVPHIIGRTSWDKANTWAINPKAQYHFCNETLRPTFYKTKWTYESCNKHTIFLSQGNYPIKGLQQVLHALPLILEHYSDTKVLVAGNNFINQKSYRLNGFANYIKHLIRIYKIQKHIQFLGLLDEDQMAMQYTKAHIFICPSSIENSPNSVGEAQLVGTPCLASYTGGTMDMISDGKTGFLYRFEETSMLAQKICNLFGNENLCKEISLQEREAARIRHDQKQNSMQLNKIYQSILNHDNLFSL